jgi:hypothetical protein
MALGLAHRQYGFNEGVERQRADQEPGVTPRALFGHAQVNHLQPLATHQRNKIAARKSRRGVAARGIAGHFNFHAQRATRHLREQACAEGRVDGVLHGHRVVAPLHTFEFHARAQQGGGTFAPGRLRRFGPGQGLQSVQHAMQFAPNVGGGFIRGGFHIFLRAHLFVLDRQPHQQRLRHHQQAHQGHPQQSTTQAAAA